MTYCLFAEANASATADIIPFELNVAPETASTAVFCADMILEITVSTALSKYHKSLSSLSAFIEIILSFSIVIVTEISPSYPNAEAV